MTDQPALRDYQVVDLAFMFSQRRSMILHDPGDGKTPPVCVWMYAKWAQNQEKSFWV